MVAMGFLSRRFESLGLCGRTEATATTAAVLPVRQRRRSRPSRSSHLLKLSNISTDFQSPDAKSDFVSDVVTPRVGAPAAKLGVANIWRYVSLY